MRRCACHGLVALRIRLKAAHCRKGTQVVAWRRKHMIDRHMGRLVSEIALGERVGTTRIADDKSSSLGEGRIKGRLVVVSEFRRGEVQMTTDKIDRHQDLLVLHSRR